MWFGQFAKPEKAIKEMTDWPTKIEAMVQAAPNWDIGIIAGVPAWLQILFEKIIERYNLNTIQDIWPNFRVVVHGGSGIRSLSGDI